MGLRRQGAFLRPIGNDPGIRKASGRQARGEVGREWALCAWIALAHGIRYVGTFWRLGDRFLNHSPAGAGEHRSVADPAGGPWRKSCVCGGRGHCGVHPGRLFDLGLGRQRRRSSAPSLSTQAIWRRLFALGREKRYACGHRLGVVSAAVSADALPAGCGGSGGFAKEVLHLL